MSGTTILVNSTAALTTAIAKLGNTGGTIELASGSYGNLVINGAHINNNIQIESQNSGSEASFNYIKINNTQNISFSYVAVHAVGSPDTNSIRINNSHNISFDHITVSGDVNSSPVGRENGMMIQNSQNVSVSNSGFSWLADGVDISNVQNLTIKDDALSFISQDGIHAANAQNVLIANNNLTNFDSIAGFHSDPIQFLTQGTTTQSSNITITGNLVYIGSDTAPQSGVFMTDQTGNEAYKNVTITDNTFIGTGWNAVYLSHAVGAVDVSNNVVSSWAGPACGTTTVQAKMEAGISLFGMSGASVTEVGNSAQFYNNDPGSSYYHAASNTVTTSPTDHGIAALHAWFAENTALAPTLSSALLGFVT